jgi:hypothetical protein
MKPGQMENSVKLAIMTAACMAIVGCLAAGDDQQIIDEPTSEASAQVSVPAELNASAHELVITDSGAKTATACSSYPWDCVAFDPDDQYTRNILCTRGCGGPAKCDIAWRPDAPSWCHDGDGDAGWGDLLGFCLGTGTCPSECFTGRCNRALYIP